jgi:hypothetical protein
MGVRCTDFRLTASRRDRGSTTGRGRVVHGEAGLSLEDYQSGGAKLTTIGRVLDSLVRAQR